MKTKSFFIISTLLILSSGSLFSQNWLWSTNPSVNNGSFNGFAVSSDANDNVFVTGGFGSPTITFGTATLTNSGVINIFITKYDASGNLQWAKCFGGTGYDESWGISTDPNGNVYICGNFTSPTITFGSYILTNAHAPYGDIFIIKLSTNGNIIWAKSAGGISGDFANSISADASGNVFVTGSFASSTITFGSTTLTKIGDSNMFIVKYSSNGNVLWAQNAGGINTNNGNSISTDTHGNVFVTGWYSCPTITFGATTLTNNGNHNIFIVKYSSGGNVLWAKSAGGTNTDQGYSLSTDTQGDVYLTGGFSSSTIVFGNDTLSKTGMFIAKYDSTGNEKWAKSGKGAGEGYSTAISSDANGNVFVTGAYNDTIIFGLDTLLYPVGNCYQTGGCIPMFVANYDANGNVICATSLASGGIPDNGAGGYQNSVSADHFGNAYLGSIFTITPFSIGTNTMTLTNSSANMFIAKYSCINASSVNEVNNEESFMVFPNPTSGKFTIENKDLQTTTFETQIFNIIGENIYQSKNSSSQSAIDISNHPSGIYFLQIKTDQGNAVRKIIMQR